MVTSLSNTNVERPGSKQQHIENGDKSKKAGSIASGFYEILTPII